MFGPELTTAGIMNQSSHHKSACAILLDTKRNMTITAANTSKVMMVASNLGV